MAPPPLYPPLKLTVFQTLWPAIAFSFNTLNDVLFAHGARFAIGDFHIHHRTLEAGALFHSLHSTQLLNFNSLQTLEELMSEPVAELLRPTPEILDKSAFAYYLIHLPPLLSVFKNVSCLSYNGRRGKTQPEAESKALERETRGHERRERARERDERETERCERCERGMRGRHMGASDASE